MINTVFNERKWHSALNVLKIMIGKRTEHVFAFWSYRQYLREQFQHKVEIWWQGISDEKNLAEDIDYLPRVFWSEWKTNGKIK